MPNGKDRSVPAGTQGNLESAEITRLYEAHAEQLRRFLLGVLGDAQLANDVLQVAFERLVERGHETAAESRKSWLFRVAYHEAIVVRRRQAVGKKVMRQLSSAESAVPELPERSLLRRETVAAVRQAIERLPAEQQQIVRMRIYEEKKFATIAQELDIPLGTALGRMRAAMIKLRAQLGKTEE